MLREIPVLKQSIPNGETIAYRKVGNQKETLLLIHGNMSSSIHYDTVMETLEKDYTIYAVDLRGFGDSTYKKPIDSLYDFAEDIKLFIDALNIESCHVFGWSTGGGVALELAVMIPEVVKKVVLIESVGIKGYPMFKKDEKGKPILTELITTKEEIEKDAVQVLPILTAIKTKNKDIFRTIWNSVIYNINQPDSERYDRYLDAMLQQRNLIDVDYALIKFNMTNEHNGVVMGTNRVELIKSPVLIIHGENDFVVPVNFALETKKHLKELAELRLLKNSGHSPITDQFDEFIEIVTAFIKE